MADTDTKHVGFKVQSTLVSLPCFFLVCDDELVRQTDSAQTKRPVTVVRAHDERVCVCVYSHRTDQILHVPEVFRDKVSQRCLVPSLGPERGSALGVLLVSSHFLLSA